MLSGQLAIGPVYPEDGEEKSSGEPEQNPSIECLKRSHELPSRLQAKVGVPERCHGAERIEHAARFGREVRQANSKQRPTLTLHKHEGLWHIAQPPQRQA